LIPFTSDDTIARAFVVGVLNTPGRGARHRPCHQRRVAVGLRPPVAELAARPPGTVTSRPSATSVLLVPCSGTARPVGAARPARDCPCPLRRHQPQQSRIDPAGPGGRLPDLPRPRSPSRWRWWRWPSAWARRRRIATGAPFPTGRVVSAS
jgi:hypothetical protein